MPSSLHAVLIFGTANIDGVLGIPSSQTIADGPEDDDVQGHDDTRSAAA
jgi:hypothetical protein